MNMNVTYWLNCEDKERCFQIRRKGTVFEKEPAYDAIGGFGVAVHDVEVLKNAIKSNKVPLVSSFENINDPMNVIGHCELEVRDDAIYATAEFIGPNGEVYEHKEILDGVRLGFYATGCDVSKDKVVKSMTIRSVALTRTCLGGKLKKEEDHET